MTKFVRLFSVFALAITLVACPKHSPTQSGTQADAGQHFYGATVVNTAGPTFVFAPGATTGPGVYTTWVTLMAAVVLTPGPKTIEVDDSLAAAHATAGTWNVDQVTFTSSTISATRTLIVDDGCVWGSPHVVNINQVVVAGASNSHVIVNTNANLSRINVAWGGSLQSTTPSAFIQNSGGFFALAGSPTGVLGDATHPVITTDGGKTSIIQLYANSSLLNNASAGAGTVIIQRDSSSAIGTGNVGTVTNQSKASQSAYTPSTPAQWNPAPTIVSDALDQLAAPNFVQAAANTGTGTGTTTAVTGNIAKLKSGKVRVSGVATGITAGGGTTVTVSLLRDATPILALPALTVLATQMFSVPINFVDTLPDAANHTYTVQAVAGAGNITCGTGGDLISAIEF